MKRKKDYSRDIKYTPKSYDQITPLDTLHNLIAFYRSEKLSLDILSKKIGICPTETKKLLKRLKLPNRDTCEKINDFLKEVKNEI